MDTTYRNRAEAGTVLADRLDSLAGRSDVTVLGLVRGGVPVAAAVADRLGAPLDVLVVRKLGLPAVPELAFGAVGPGGLRVLNEEIADRLDPDEVDEVVRAETVELERRERRYREGRPPLRLDGRIGVIVDDGLATGATARAAVGVARQLGARRVVVAVPVGAPEAYALLSQTADEVVCPQRPADFGAVSRFYEDFHEVSDAEVVAALTGSG
ncbi:phosphoribosyltransferase [Plantactinospora sonchi]|uniref:Phosphoribosyltransferase family protein n=1 Tax=Plantactinospora sonchi TaxID=1544735 RepID=A0ABU7RPI9_9ACTN